MIKKSSKKRCKPLKGLRKCGGRRSKKTCLSNPNCNWNSDKICRPKYKRRKGSRLPPIIYGPTLPPEILADPIYRTSKKNYKKSRK